MRYNSGSMKKLIVSLIALVIFAIPGRVLATDTTTVCTQYYGGGVVCGVHTPVNTGIVDNIPLIGSLLLGSSGVLYFISKKRNK
jgi:hypothetical protein